MPIHFRGRRYGSHALRGHAGAVFSLTSAKGQLFSAAQDAAVRVWPLGKGAAAAAAAEPPASVELVGHAGFVRALAVSGGGALLFSGSADKSVRVWDTNTHVQLCALSGHKHEVHALAVHNDLLFSGAEDATIKVWNIASLKCIRTLAGANGQESPHGAGSLSHANQGHVDPRVALVHGSWIP